MSATHTRTFFALASLLLASCGDSSSTPTPAAPGGGSIAGTVGTENLLSARILAATKPSVDGMTVYLWDARNARGPKDSTHADATGRFRFANLPTGQWVVSVAQTDLGAISDRVTLEGSADRTQNLSLDRWIVGWVAIDTTGSKIPTEAHILGIPGSLPIKPGFVQVKSLPNQKLELILGDADADWSKLEISPIEGTPSVVGAMSTSWTLNPDPWVGWDFNSATPFASFTKENANLPASGSLRAVDAYQALRFDPTTIVSVETNVGVDSGYRYGFYAKVWVDSLPGLADSGLGVIADLGSRGFELALRSDGRLRLVAKRGDPAGYSATFAPSTFSFPLNSWVEVAASVDRVSGFALWMNGQKIPLDPPSVDTGLFFPRPADLTKLTLGASAVHGRLFPGAIRELRVYRSAPYLPK